MDAHREAMPLPPNVEAWELWENIQLCWETTMSGFLGLRWGDVRVVAEALGIEWTDDLLKRIRILEEHQLQWIAKKDEHHQSQHRR